MLQLKDKPLVQWTFAKLYKKKIRKLFTDVLVSTDLKEIINLCKNYQFLTPWVRPKKFSGKFSTSGSTALHALRWYEKNVHEVDGLFLFQPTSPFRTDSKIILSIKLFSKNNKQIVSICGKKTYKFSEGDINGSIYLTPVSILKKFKTFSVRGFVPLKMTTELENIDIDTQEDLNRAKKLLKNI